MREPMCFLTQRDGGVGQATDDPVVAVEVVGVARAACRDGLRSFNLELHRQRDDDGISCRPRTLNRLLTTHHTPQDSTA